ncbi:hypothetical protein M3J09_001045 [Ascochyta lentis]
MAVQSPHQETHCRLLHHDDPRSSKDPCMSTIQPPVSRSIPHRTAAHRTGLSYTIKPQTPWSREQPPTWPRNCAAPGLSNMDPSVQTIVFRNSRSRPRAWRPFC